MSEPYLSVVVPVFNEEENLPELLSRLSAALEALTRQLRGSPGQRRQP